MNSLNNLFESINKPNEAKDSTKKSFTPKKSTTNKTQIKENTKDTKLLRNNFNLLIPKQSNTFNKTTLTAEINNQDNKNNDSDFIQNNKVTDPIQITKAIKLKNKLTTDNKVQQKPQNSVERRTTFTSKPGFIMNNIQKFKQEKEEEVEEKPRVHSSDSNTKNKMINYDNVQSKVKQFIRRETEPLEQSVITDKNNKIEIDKKPKKAKTVGNKDNFYNKLNMKKGYHDKNRSRPKKFDKYKKFDKLNKEQELKSDNVYFGKGSTGVDDIDSMVKDEEGQFIYSEMANQIKIPYFSEGYLNNELREHHNDSKTPSKSIIPITQRLSTIFKSNNLQKEAFFSAIRDQSKEFKKLIKTDNIEKKLDFTEPILEVKETPTVEKSKSKQEKYKNIDPELIDDMLSDDEVINLEDEILTKVLQDNFKFERFRDGQLTTIKNILNNKKTLSILKGKGLCFQLPSLVFDGLTVFISPFINQLHKHLLSLSDCLSGACLSGLTSNANRHEILNAIHDKKIKILFITPERFIIEHNNLPFDDVSLICIDEAITFSSIPFNNISNQKVSYFTLNKLILEKYEKSSLLLFSSISDCLSIEQTKLLYKIDEVVLSHDIIKPNVDIFVSKEEESKRNELLNRILQWSNTSSKRNSGGCILVLCNYKKKVDEVTYYITHNSGMNCLSYHSGKSENDKQLIMNALNANSNTLNKARILVTTPHFLNGLSKNDIRLIISYDIPLNLESLYSIITKAGNDSKPSDVHFMLNDEDYFYQKNFILGENLDEVTILRLLDYILSLTTSSYNLKVKRSLNDIDSNVIISDNKMIKYKASLPITLCVCFSAITELLGIKKSYVILILNFLKMQESVSIDIIDICPSIIILRFYKTSAEELSEKENNIKILLEISKESSGAYKFNTSEACSQLNMKPNELLRYLFSLQIQKLISYEAKEEGILIKINELPDSLDNIALITSTYIRNCLLYNLRKLDLVYILLRNYSILKGDLFKLEHFDSSKSIKCLTQNMNYNEYKNKYLLSLSFLMSKEVSINYKNDLAEEDNHLLPVYRIDSQKDKSNLSVSNIFIL